MIVIVNNELSMTETKLTKDSFPAGSVKEKIKIDDRQHLSQSNGD